MLRGRRPGSSRQLSGFPTISERQFTGGSAKVTVTGSTTIEQEIPLNTKASYGDGEATWLQFGVSGSAEPNALITYGDIKEIGVSVGKGKFIATGGIMPGDYVCTGVTSGEGGGKMGKVDIKVSFTAKS